MWELPDKTKEVKVHWFFCPKEISKWLGETMTLENEILFATGEGLGLSNTNPLWLQGFHDDDECENKFLGLMRPLTEIEWNQGELALETGLRCSREGNEDDYETSMDGKSEVANIEEKLMVSFGTMSNVLALAIKVRSMALIFSIHLEENNKEAIIGQCNVVCLSKDNRNPQPSDEQLKAADFVFYHTFDVQCYAILDKMDDKVGGLEIKYVFNREESEKTNPFLESASDTKKENPNIFISSETQQQKDDAKGESPNKGIPSLLERNTSFKESDKSHNRPLKKRKSDGKCVEPVVALGFEKMTDMPSMKSMVDKADEGGMKVGIVPVQKVENKMRNKTPAGSDKLYDQPLKKLKSDDKKPPEDEPLKKLSDDKKPPEEKIVDSKSKNEDKSPADVNNLKASGARGTTEDRKNSTISAKVTSVDLEGKKLKRTRDDGSFKVPANRMGTNTNVRDLFALSKEKSKSGTALDILGVNKYNNYNKEGKVEQSGESKKKLSMNKLLKALSTDKDKKNTYREFVVSSKETSNWFKRLPWDEDRLKKAYDEGTAILLPNVDPDYNSGEVEGIIRHAFKEKCDARILQHTSVSSPHYAQALIILKTKEAAQKVLKKLDEECLMLSNGRPLVATPCPPISTKKNSIFFGHLAIDKARFQNQRELMSMKCWEKLHEVRTPRVHTKLCYQVSTLASISISKKAYIVQHHLEGADSFTNLASIRGVFLFSLLEKNGILRFLEPIIVN
ncbi:hypothetical protein L1987_05161 [Smallanthus sonchifolius]|uniref:Uncharacterized protein n=1 Tax=Smallanthus sonchifolius TaxID=185202 RepID=A0ACB9JUL4_9ASTR|nr:hypothetical protein L1987_05161 [Smallanthus sonchifolius]